MIIAKEDATRIMEEKNEPQGRPSAVMEPFIYFYPSALSLRKLQHHLPPEPRYRIILEQDELRPAVVLDTFDGGLFYGAKLLFQVGGQLLFVDMQTGQMLEQVTGVGPGVIGDMAKGPVAAMLAEISWLRALLPVADVQVRRERGRVLDDEGKTLVRLNHVTIRRGRKMVGIGSARYLRGYAEAYGDLRQWLERSGAMACQDGGEMYASLRIEQPAYNVKPEIGLLPEAPAKESATIILQTFVKIARCNEAGVLADHDTEFLHDYRVCLRKARSVLSLFSGVFSVEDSVRLKSELATLMRITNGLRDLDVYLLNRAEYHNLVPPSTQAGLQILFEGFADKRKGELKKVVGTMKSKNYQHRMEKLATLFAASQNLGNGPQAETPSRLFACRLILKRYRQVCKTARQLDETTPDQSIHELRIRCKKLRYLMEFFAPLFPAGDIKQLIKPLKLLQDNLGRFNDYSVQQQFLGKVLANETASGPKALAVAQSIGALTAMLYRLQAEERNRIIENLAGFDSPEIRAAFYELFHSADGADENNRLLQ
jgi:CHAD domain-containing protein